MTKERLPLAHSVPSCPLIIALALAVPATALSLVISALSGWDRGSSIAEKCIWAAFGGIAVAGAHFLPTLWRRSPMGLRSMAIALWLPCMAFVAYAHASYFLLSQQQAGIVRMTTVNQAVLLEIAPTRPLSHVMNEQAKVRAQLLIASSNQCDGDCAKVKAKVAILQTKLDALAAEAEEARRNLTARDRRELIKDAVREDPVASQVAQLIGMTAAQVGFMSAVLVFLVLDGLACLGWLMVMQSRPGAVTQLITETTPMEVTPSITAAVTSPLPPSSAGDVSRVTRVTDPDDVTQRLLDEVRAGRLQLTVKSVRASLHCAQSRASEITKVLKAIIEEASDQHSAMSTSP